MLWRGLVSSFTFLISQRSKSALGCLTLLALVTRSGTSSSSLGWRPGTGSAAGGPAEEVVSGLVSSRDEKETRGTASKAPLAANRAAPSDAAEIGSLRESKDNTPDADTCGPSSTAGALSTTVDAGISQGSEGLKPTYSGVRKARICTTGQVWYVDSTEGGAS